MQKLKALFTTGSGLTLVVLFVYGGLEAISTHLTGSAGADIVALLSLIGVLFHPTNMVAGKSVSA